MCIVLFEDYLLSSTSLLTKATLPYSLPGSKASWVSLALTSLSGFHSPCVFPASLQQPLACVLVDCFAASPLPSLQSVIPFPCSKPSMASQSLQGKGPSP